MASMTDKKTALRVLYSINGTQYILARSFVPVPYTLIELEVNSQPSGSSGNLAVSARYGSVSLKTCLDTICRSSPELSQDSSRDFSLYVLDPLESNSAPALMNISNATGGSSCSINTEEQARGVAVAYGPMSWALTSEEATEIMANGTMIKQPTGQEALEVVFALRETVAPKSRTMNRPSTSLQTPSSSQESSSSQSSSQGDAKPLQWLSQRSVVSSTFTRSASTPDLTRETLASIQMRSKSKAKPSKPPRRSNTPMTESDKLMACDVYIGPLKKKGRPRTTGLDSRSSSRSRTQPVASTSTITPQASEQEVIVIDGSDNESQNVTPKVSTFAGVPSTNQPNEGSMRKKRTSKTPSTAPFTSVPLVRQNTEVASTISPTPPTETKAEHREPTVLDLLTLFSATSSPSDSNVPNAAVLAALNAIDASKSQSDPPSSDTAPNPALVDALRQLLALCAQQPTTPPTPALSAASIPLPTSANIPSSQTSPLTPSTPIPMSQHHRRSSSSLNEVVVLDKENVNPTVFRKRSDKEGAGEASSSTSHSERPILSLGLSSRSNEVQSISAPPRSCSSLPGSDRGLRKRTLSDFMDEKESGRSKDKGKEREKRNSSKQRSQPKPDALRHYPGVLAATLPRQAEPTNYYRTPLEPWTSPVRPPRDNDENNPTSNSHLSSPSRSPPKLPSPRHQRVPASSPIRPSRDSRKKYTVPAWARTNTATQPRLSEEAQRSMEQAEAKRKEERNATRRRSANSGAKLDRRASTSTLKADPPSSQNEPPQPPRPQFLIPKQPEVSRGPVAASSDGPLIAFPLVAAASRSSSPPPNPPFVPKTPKTPSRPRVRSTPGTEGDSLFTPIRRSGASLFGSALSQRSPHGTPPSILTSPLGNRKKAKITPTRSLLTCKGIGALRWPNLTSPKSSTDSVGSEEHENRSSSLKHDLDEPLDDLDCPPSSLPIASSDMDVIDAQPQPSAEGDEGEGEGEVTIDADEDDTQVQPIQHWAGLPPSSPPAPSSPMLLPEDTRTDDEMDELPIATSDSETDADMSAFETDATSPDDVCLTDEAVTPTDEQCMAFTDEDYNAFFSMEANPSSTFQALSSSTTLDLFEQFTNVNAQSDDLQPSAMDPSAAQEGLMDPIDFTEFWETFKPLLNDSSHAQSQAGEEQPAESQQASADTFFSDDSQLFAGVDHTKLADDMRALLSGCLM